MKNSCCSNQGWHSRGSLVWGKNSWERDTIHTHMQIHNESNVPWFNSRVCLKSSYYQRKFFYIQKLFTKNRGKFYQYRIFIVLSYQTQKFFQLFCRFMSFSLIFTKILVPDVRQTLKKVSFHVFWRKCVKNTQKNTYVSKQFYLIGIIVYISTDVCMSYVHTHISGKKERT